MMRNIYQVKYCSVIIRFVRRQDDGRGGVRGWGDRLDAATAAEAETAHSLLRIAKGGAPASSISKPNRPHSVGHPPDPVGSLFHAFGEYFSGKFDVEDKHRAEQRAIDLWIRFVEELNERRRKQQEDEDKKRRQQFTPQHK